MPTLTQISPHEITPNGSGGDQPPIDEIRFADGGEDERYVRIGLEALTGYLYDAAYAEQVDKRQLTGHELLVLGSAAAQDVQLREAA